LDKLDVQRAYLPSERGHPKVSSEDGTIIETQTRSEDSMAVGQMPKGLAIVTTKDSKGNLLETVTIDEQSQFTLQRNINECYHILRKYFSIMVVRSQLIQGLPS
jgi:hypothetical protein